MLIEGNSEETQSIVDRLRQRGYEVIWAQTGVVGLQLAANESPDLVLLDVDLSDMNGYAVCRFLRVSEKTKEIPVLMLTDRGSVQDRIMGLGVGANDYLPKPLDLGELEARIYANLRTLALQAELKQKNRQLEELLAKFEQLASTDSLTDLYNRRRFFEELRREFSRSKRYQMPLCCMLIDIDHFKNVNDTFGHHWGDYVLSELSKILKETFRISDIVARYGGEEFIVLLPQTDMDGAFTVAERLRERVAKHSFWFEHQLIHITISVGIASFFDLLPGQAEETLIQCADKALYQAKANGRNRVEIFSREACPTFSQQPSF